MIYLDGECGSGGGGKGSKGVMWERDEGCGLWGGVGDEEGEEEQEVEHGGTMCPSETGGCPELCAFTGWWLFGAAESPRE